MAPEDIQAAAKKLEGKTIGCFATMGGNAETPEALDWMKRTSESLAAAGKNNTLVGTYLCRGRMDLERGVERFRTIFGVNW